MSVSFHQRIVYDFVRRTFGIQCAHDKHERAMRFLEEAMELAQCHGVTNVEVASLINRVFRRPVGDAEQEAGQAQLTFLALCCANDYDPERLLEKEILRALNLDPDELRARWKDKAAQGVARLS